ncbi:MAG: hypothetical protein WDW38_003668 [Sanguina aurantia]
MLYQSLPAAPSGGRGWSCGPGGSLDAALSHQPRPDSPARASDVPGAWSLGVGSPSAERTATPSHSAAPAAAAASVIRGSSQPTRSRYWARTAPSPSPQPPSPSPPSSCPTLFQNLSQP